MKWAAGLVALSLVSRCGKSEPQGDATPAAPSASAARAAPPAAAVDWIQRLPTCDVEHLGTFLDVGTPAVEGRRDHSPGPFQDVEVQERAGSTFGRVHGRRLAYELTLPAPAEGAAVSLRALAGTSRQVTVYVDDRRLAALALPRDEPKILVTTPIDRLAAGPHTVTLRFGGGSLGPDEPFAEIDWIRVGPPLAVPESYAAPTLRDIVTDVALGGVPKRAIVLRSPSSVRCSLRPLKGTRFATSLGYWGNGEGTAQVRLIEDGEPPRVLAERRVTGGADTVWSPLTIDMDAFAGRIVALELSAPEASGSGRVAFGEPALLAVRDGEPPGVSPARLVVVVVAAGLDRRMVPPWGPQGGLPTVGRLVRDGAAFDGYRVPTTVVGGVVASLLTGLPPRAHGLEAPLGSLGSEVRLVSELVKQSSTHSAFFTAVPSTFPAFGFDRGWDHVESFSPVRDVAATEPYQRGATWLKEQLARDREARLLLVVHARGGHPPWDVTRDEVATLPPEEYSGPIEPRAGALVLANLRGSRPRGPADQRLTGDDWRRLRALEEAALRKQDGGLRKIVEVLEKEGVYDRTLFILVGDVAVGDPPGIPFSPAPPLREDVLVTPLIVKFPEGRLAGTQTHAAVTTTDVTATVLASLGVVGDGGEGTDLLRIAAGDGVPAGHPLVATLASRYATRWGPWILSGEFGRRPSLCQADVDPACVTDALAESPLAAEALWRRTYEAAVDARRRRPRGTPPPPAALDGDTQAALKVFGY